MKLYDVEQVALEVAQEQRENIKAARQSRSPKFAEKRVL
jgi:hypothetical protein